MRQSRAMPVLTEAKRWCKPRDPNSTRRASDLTPAEQEHVRKALRFLRVRLGGWEPLATAMQANTNTVWRVTHGGPVSAGIALRAARVAGVGVEEVLSGPWPMQGTCPHCGKT